jgi:hypothetical protein
MGPHDDYGEDGPPVWYAPENNLSYVNTLLAAMTGWTVVIRIRLDVHGERYASHEVVYVGKAPIYEK